MEHCEMARGAVIIGGKLEGGRGIARAPRRWRCPVLILCDVDYRE